MVAPDYAFRKIAGKAGKIKKHAKINDLGFAFLFSLLEKQIESYSPDSYESFLAQANKLSPRGVGNKDDPYFALALFLNASIWSALMPIIPGIFLSCYMIPLLLSRV